MIPVSQVTSSQFERLIDNIEKTISVYYDLHIECKASQCVIDDHLDHGTDHPGQLLILQEEDLFVGLHFSQNVLDSIRLDIPPHQQSASELNALLVVIEEVSHFHLVCDRARIGRPTSMLELEWQSEIDKIIVLESLLHRCAVSADLYSLYGLLSEKTFISQNYNKEKIARYISSTRLFCRFWQKIIAPELAVSQPRATMLSEKIRSILKKYYRMTWQEKIFDIAA